VNSSPRLAFYPCCASDIAASHQLLKEWSDEILYCDLRQPDNWKSDFQHLQNPSVRFHQGDVRKLLPQLPTIHAFFYRRDSSGEGGSNIYLLGKFWLRKILEHFPEKGGVIITDGSNRGGGLFGKMTRPSGYARKSWGWRFQADSNQHLLETLRLYIIHVSKIGPEGE